MSEWHEALREVAEEVALELQQLRRLLAAYADLRAGCAEHKPNLVEVTALAALLHTFYSGIENILKRIAIGVDGTIPGGSSWHRELLEQSARPSLRRPAVISDGLRKRLLVYLEFRHVFRNLYLFNLDWGKMRPLVIDCDSVLLALTEESDRFLKGLLGRVDD